MTIKYIYKIENDLGVYIGKTCDCKSREKQHARKNNGTRSVQINNEPFDFKVLETTKNDDTSALENYYIDKFRNEGKNVVNKIRLKEKVIHDKMIVYKIFNERGSYVGITTNLNSRIRAHRSPTNRNSSKVITLDENKNRIPFEYKVLETLNFSDNNYHEKENYYIELFSKTENVVNKKRNKVNNCN